jgi:hypothetical protein
MADSLQEPVPCPLGDEHCAMLDQSAQIGAVLADWLHKCDQAGLNVEKLKAECNRRNLLTQGLKQQFFPHKP